MLGGRSIQLARIFGVRIGVDPSWFVILFVIIWSLSGYFGRIYDSEATSFTLAAASALLFFVSVVLHELGHAVVALRNGIRITGIDLWLFGGVARMSRDTDSAGVEFRVAVAGPLVTLGIGVACFALAVLASGGDVTLGALDPANPPSPPVAMLGYLAVVNLTLLVFNLIPGFPLDGGRIVRAIAWKVTGDRTRATRFAARLGRGCGYLMIGLGIFIAVRGSIVSGVWLALIGLFLGQAARSAEAQTRLTAGIAGLRVADVMDAEPVAVPAETPLEQAHDEYFLRYRWPWFPVVDAAGRLVGVLRREDVEEVPELERHATSAGQVVTADPATYVGVDEPLESLLGLEGMRRLGALMAVDDEGVLRGVVTVDRVRRAMVPVAAG